MTWAQKHFLQSPMGKPKQTRRRNAATGQASEEKLRKKEMEAEKKEKEP